MTVTAPFRFSRINRFIVEPEWGPLATHDVPFKDGVSGTATITLRAITPFLIGGNRIEQENGSGTVKPFKLGDDPVIPDATMQGLCRSLLEIAGFGRLGPWIEKRRYGIRDLAPTRTAEVHYRSRLSSGNKDGIRPKSMAGWLIGDASGLRIVKCDLSRIRVDDDVYNLMNSKRAAVGFPKETRNPFTRKENADTRYEKFLAGLRKFDDLEGRFNIDPPAWQRHSRGMRIFYSRCTPAVGAGGTLGTLILTGKPQNGTAQGQKKWEFVFHNPCRSGVTSTSSYIDVPDAVMEAFEALHEEQKGRPINPNWAYWKAEFKAGRPIPVFYWSDSRGQLDTFGMAFAFKAAHTNNAHDLLANSDPGHLMPVEEAPLDLPSLIFGSAAEGNRGRGLKRRAWFGLGRRESGGEERRAGTTILLGPKPNYLGIYIRQKPDGDSIRTQSEAFASYSPVDSKEPLLGTPHMKHPELSGVKLWPASHEKPTSLSVSVPQGLEGNHSVQTTLYALPPETIFNIPLTFHNLRPQELGALLWVLSFGENVAFDGNVEKVRLHHRLGMGKPYGLGEVALAVSLNVDDDTRSAMEFIDCFKSYMVDAFKKRSVELGLDEPVSWERSVQIKALKKAADPEQNNPNELHYMSLSEYVYEKGGKKHGNVYDGHFMFDYTKGSEFPRPNVPPTAKAAQQVAAPPPTPEEAGPPVVGARVRFGANRSKDVAGKEGVILKAGEGEFADYLIQVERGPRKNFKKTLFYVIAPPPDA